MQRLSSIILITYFLFLSHKGFCQKSPHGEIRISCEDCHSVETWRVYPSQTKFDHNKTKFRLEAQHKKVECIQCHKSLKFGLIKSDCVNCHQDVHQNTVGTDCQNCHNSESWLVKNIREIHNRTRFPIIGAHQSLNCNSCHSNFNLLRFEVQGVDCFDCHRKDYEQAKNPDHKISNFPTECNDCHSFEKRGWGGTNFTHSFFPLVGGHSIRNCFNCHKNQNFRGLDKQCVSCHLNNYQQTQNPNHQRVGFSTNCEICHNINTWKDARFDHDNLFFPIYSGEHRGKWNTCFDCHTNQNNYSEFSCVNCHEHNKARMDDKHRNVSGYLYESRACLSCHPRGN